MIHHVVMPRLLALLAAGIASPVMAQSVGPCDWQAAAQAIVEPWEENTRVFANGATRIAALDTVEPALGASHLLVLSPPLSALGERQCRVVSFAGDTGFVALDFAMLEAGYSPNIGLVFAVPVRVASKDTSFTNSAILTVTLNQATGAIDAKLALGAE